MPPPEVREPYRQRSAAAMRSLGGKFFGGNVTVAAPLLSMNGWSTLLAQSVSI